MKLRAVIAGWFTVLPLLRPVRALWDTRHAGPLPDHGRGAQADRADLRARRLEALVLRGVEGRIAPAAIRRTIECRLGQRSL